jgi:hypothetical protein
VTTRQLVWQTTRQLVWQALVLARRELARLRRKERDQAGHEHRPPGPGGGQFTGQGSGGAATADRPAAGSKKPPLPKGAVSKPLKTAARFRDVARRRRVIAAVKVEGELADGIGGVNLPDSEPADVVYAEDARGKRISDPRQLRDYLRHREMLVRTAADPKRPAEVRAHAREGLEKMPLHFFECKTILVAKEGAVHMSKAALARKERWSRKYGAAFHVVAVDRRRGSKHSGHEVHLAASELAGTFRLDKMDKVNSFSAVLGRVCPGCDGGQKELLYGILRSLRLRQGRAPGRR